MLTVSIALGRQAVAECTALDRDRNGTVEIFELIVAVASALGGGTASNGTCGTRADSRGAVPSMVMACDSLPLLSTPSAVLGSFRAWRQNPSPVSESRARPLASTEGLRTPRKTGGAVSALMDNGAVR